MLAFGESRGKRIVASAKTLRYEICRQYIGMLTRFGAEA